MYLFSRYALAHLSTPSTLTEKNLIPLYMLISQSTDAHLKRKLGLTWSKLVMVILSCIGDSPDSPCLSSLIVRVVLESKLKISICHFSYHFLCICFIISLDPIDLTTAVNDDVQKAMMLSIRDMRPSENISLEEQELSR